MVKGVLASETELSTSDTSVEVLGEGEWGGEGETEGIFVLFFVAVALGWTSVLFFLGVSPAFLATREVFEVLGLLIIYLWSAW